MLQNLKALVVILVAAAIMFHLMRPLCLTCMLPETFARRRNVWFALTIVAFFSPSFAIYALFSIGLLLWAGKKDRNPLGLYVLLAFVVPDARFFIPTFFVNQLFDLTNYRILSLFVLLPWIVRSIPAWRSSGRSTWTIYDTAMVAFLSIFVVNNLPYESATAAMRRSFLFAIDLVIVLYAFSRLDTKEKLADAMATFCVSTGIMALVAIVEWSKGWLLYTGLATGWGDPNIFAYLLRGDRLRAQAAAQGPLNLGYHLAVGLVFYVCLRARLRNRLYDWFVMGIMTVGLYATASRGPWLTAAVALLLFMLSRPNALRRLVGVVVVSVLALGIMYVTPLRESVIDRLPIIGSADQDTIEYRQQLASISWGLIDRSPFLGDPLVSRYMESMRQGQGIIDIVNGYLYTLLFTGWVGMILQASVFVAALVKSFVVLVRVRSTHPDLGALGAALIASFLASLLYIASAGYGSTTYLLAGLLLSYSSLAAGGRLSVSVVRAVEPLRAWPGNRPALG